MYQLFIVPGYVALTGGSRAPGDFGFDPLGLNSKGSQKDKGKLRIVLNKLMLILNLAFCIHRFNGI